MTIEEPRPIHAAPRLPEGGAFYDIAQRELGIGDIICSLYGLYGFSLAHGEPRIRLHMQDHLDWLRLVAIPNLEVVKCEGGSLPVNFLELGDDEPSYRKKLRAGISPKEWYARKLGVAPVCPPLNEAFLGTAPLLETPYILLSPFATRVNRNWEIHNWRILARNLRRAGFGVVALDAPNQPERCEPIGVEYFWGQSIEWIASACHHASLIVSGDSAFAHVGGLLGAKTLVVLSQQEPEKHFAMTRNQFVQPDHPCVGCRFQPDRGYEEKCDFGCWTLQSISPEVVTARALKIAKS